MAYAQRSEVKWTCRRSTGLPGFGIFRTEWHLRGRSAFGGEPDVSQTCVLVCF
jgi:hypothetical protein